MSRYVRVLPVAALAAALAGCGEGAKQSDPKVSGGNSPPVKQIGRQADGGAPAKPGKAAGGAPSSSDN